MKGEVMDSSNKKETLLEVLKILATKDWDDITTVSVIFIPDRIEEILYVLQTEPNITENEFLRRCLNKRK